MDGLAKFLWGSINLLPKHLENSNEEIFEKLCKERHFNIDLYGVTKEFTFNYIEKVKGFYKQIPKEEYVQLVERILQSDKLVRPPKQPKVKGGKGKKPFKKSGKDKGNRGGRGKRRGGR